MSSIEPGASFGSTRCPFTSCRRRWSSRSRKKFIEIENITTLRLGDLISMMLHSGVKNVARAQDLADVIGLIRQHNLTAAFSAKIDAPMRGAFRKLVKAVRGKQ